MTEKTNLGLVEWVKGLVGQPYWYGTCSYRATSFLLNSKTAQFPKHYQESRMSRYRQDIENGAIVQDCVGIIKGYYWTREDGTMKYGLDGRPDKGANGMYRVAKAKGLVLTMPEIPGLIVHSPGHLGVYTGNGQVIEARGFKFGVVITALRDRPWINWFECPYIEYRVV